MDMNNLSIFFYNEDDKWVAHCLEMNIRGFGDIPEEAFEVVEDMIRGGIAISMKYDGNLDNLNRPADPKLFEEFRKGKEIAKTVKKLDKARKDANPNYSYNLIAAAAYG